MIKVGIIGGAGYTAGEAIRLLLNHPQAKLVFVHSNSNPGNPLYAVHADLLGETSMCFCGDLRWDVDVVFLCMGHGDSRKFIEQNDIPETVKIIDLSQDFRLGASSVIGVRKFVYGLTEMNKDKIAEAENIANPGCFATCLQLALLPLATAGKLNSDVHISATTGSTGAGQKPTATTHFSWRANNLSVYKAFDHQHLDEIGESIKSLQPSFGEKGEGINFIPYRGDFTRGIFASVYTESDLSQDEAVALYTHFYRNSSFTFVSEKPVDLKQVVNTNKCLLHIERKGKYIFITSVIDNLLKGASGQAVENMNLMFGITQDTGLRLKASAF